MQTFFRRNLECKNDRIFFPKNQFFILILNNFCKIEYKTVLNINFKQKFLISNINWCLSQNWTKSL